MKKIYILFCLLILGVSGFSQRLWIESDFTKEVIRNLELSFSPQARFKEALVLKEYFIETQLEYEFFNYFQLGAGYRLGNNINKDGLTESYGRFNIDAKAKYNWRNLQPKIRLRLTNANDFADEDNDPVSFLRYKGELEYSIDKIRSEPYIIYELYHDLLEKELSKARTETGLLFKISKRHRIGAYYRLNDYLKSDKESIHIIGLLYKLKI